MSQPSNVLSSARPGTSPSGGSAFFGPMLEYLGLVVVLAGLIAVFSICDQDFFGRNTLLNITSQIPATTLTTIGMTYVLIIAGIDLSVGSVLALSGAVLGVLMTQHGTPLPLAIAAALGVGILCGLFNGTVSILWQLPSFIVTLGMLEIARGATHLVTQSQTQYVGSSLGVLAGVSVPALSWVWIVIIAAAVASLWFARLPLPHYAAIAGMAAAFIGSSLLHLSVLFLFAVVAVIIGQLVLSCTVFGRYMVAIGTNEEAVRLSGVDPRPVKLAVFVLCAMLASMGGVIDASRLESVDPNTGNGLELKAIAAAVIGGTSLMGGRGSAVRSFFGVLIMAVLGHGLVGLGAKDETKRLVTGCVIIAAAILDFYRRRLGSRAER